MSRSAVAPEVLHDIAITRLERFAAAALKGLLSDSRTVEMLLKKSISEASATVDAVAATAFAFAEAMERKAQEHDPRR